MQYSRMVMERNKIRKVICAREASAIDFAVAQDGNFYVSGEAGTENVCRAGASSNDISGGNRK